MSLAAYQKARYAKMPASTCHPERKEHAGGLCRSCYRKGARAPKATCHPDRPRVVGSGLCQKCYNDQPEMKAQRIRSRRLKKYGLTQEQYDALGKECSICGGPTEAVDHCHKTGVVRGLLCRTCNAGLGFFKEDPKLLSQAAHYLNFVRVPGERKGNWLQTASGRQFWPLDPRANEIFIDDIAHALSLYCRFGGHSRYHYSVAQHSLFVMDLVPQKDKLHALLHDAPEAYLGDVINPLKRMLPEYQRAEHGVWLAVCERFDISPCLPTSVRYADRIAVMTERRDICSEAPASWGPGFEDIPPSVRRITVSTPQQVKRKFLEAFAGLTKNKI